MARLAIDVFKSPSLALLLAVLFAERPGKNGRYARLSVIFYPRAPHHRYMIWKVLKYMRAGMMLYADVERKPPSNALYIIWFDQTFVDPRAGDELPTEGQGSALNRRLRDISKRRVEAVSIDVFGYGLAIEPTTYCGDCVEKSNLNGKHDGRVIRCPFSQTDPEKVYQRLVNNSTGGGSVMDIRIPIINGSIPFAYLKYRPIDARFSNTNKKVIATDASRILSSDEAEKVKEFCTKIGLDIGELDMLRDNDSGKIYIVDVNSTFYGPPNHLGLFGSMWAIRRYSDVLNDRVGEGSGFQVGESRA